jgi:hypothetical protein
MRFCADMLVELRLDGGIDIGSFRLRFMRKDWTVDRGAPHVNWRQPLLHTFPGGAFDGSVILDPYNATNNRNAIWSVSRSQSGCSDVTRKERCSDHSCAKEDACNKRVSYILTGED